MEERFFKYCLDKWWQYNYSKKCSAVFSLQPYKNSLYLGTSIGKSYLNDIEIKFEPNKDILESYDIDIPSSMRINLNDKIYEIFPKETINHVPVIQDRKYNIKMNEKKLIILDAKDEDGDKLTYFIRKPKHGTLTKKNDNIYIYTPNKNYVGKESLWYEANDGEYNSSTKDIIIYVEKEKIPNAFEKEGRTVIDNLRNKQWQKYNNIEKTWDGAKEYCFSLTLDNNYSDWRLPSEDELSDLFKRYPNFTGVSGSFWSSFDGITSPSDSATFVNTDGKIQRGLMKDHELKVMCVRDKN